MNGSGQGVCSCYNVLCVMMQQNYMMIRFFSGSVCRRQQAESLGSPLPETPNLSPHMVGEEPLLVSTLNECPAPRWRPRAPLCRASESVVPAICLRDSRVVLHGRVLDAANAPLVMAQLWLQLPRRASVSTAFRASVGAICPAPATIQSQVAPAIPEIMGSPPSAVDVLSLFPI